MAISTVGVIGLGTMGAGIAEVVARHGCAVIAVENDAVGGTVHFILDVNGYFE